jgi:thiol-disulfide isomerase/thioredoxin
LNYKSKLTEGNFILYIVSACLIAYLLAQKTGVFGYGTVTTKSLTNGKLLPTHDVCESKERCIIYYMTPWCPSCQAAVPFVNDLKNRVDRTTKVGLKIVIGSDDLSTIESFATKISGPVYYDPDSSFGQALNLSGVPAILVADQNKKIIKRDFPAYLSGGGNSDENFDYFNKNYLGLEDYF